MIEPQSEDVIAAQYLRMSTEHQQYSIDNQREYISKYAEEQGISIRYTYDDAGKSGLKIADRPGLCSLLNDIYDARITVSVILVYDVSRFGRCQDIEEPAYHSYMLRQKGVRIIYCAEPFSESQPELFMLGLSYSRYGAAHYSKNLSDKVFIGQANLIRHGYHQGGKAGYGMRRLLVDEKGKTKDILRAGQRKSLQTERVILIPGPIEEVNVVNRIFDMLIDENKPEIVIASELNRLNVAAEDGSRWTRGKIHHILTSERYIGNSVYNRTSFRLKGKHVKNPESEWVRCDDAWKSIVSREKFYAAQRIINKRSIKLSDEELLEQLKRLLVRKGRLSGMIIDEEELFPSSSIFRSRFGGLIRAYKLIGYNPRVDYSWFETKKTISGINTAFSEQIIQTIYRLGGWVTDSGTINRFCVNEEFVLSINAVRCQRLSSGKLRWRISFKDVSFCDMMLYPRLDSTNKTIVDYYLIPTMDILSDSITLNEENGFIPELYRFDNLECLEMILKRTPLEV